MHESRPWGEFTVLLDCPGHKVKKITINPGARLSLQSHKHRDEYWTVVSGTGLFTMGSSSNLLDTNPCAAGDSMEIFAGELHRMQCTSDVPLVLIEVQLGDYTGEDDIYRYEDNYGRANETF